MLKAAGFAFFLLLSGHARSYSPSGNLPSVPNAFVQIASVAISTTSDDGENKEIARQRGVIAAGESLRFLLIIILILVGVIAILGFYNNAKTKKLNRIINRQKRDLELTSQVKDRIFSVVSHDMRSPINTLIAFIQLLEHEDVTPEQLIGYTAQLKQSLTYTSALIDNLLNWASSQMQGFKAVIENVEVNSVIEDVLNSIQPQANKKTISITNSIQPGTFVFADINMAQLVFRNLISNAVKYTHLHGQVVLSSELREDKVLIYIKDDGTGMHPEAVSSFNSDIYLQFTESTPGTNKEKGTGLGLVLCKNFATLMDGEIRVKSELGKGSLFSVTLRKG